MLDTEPWECPDHCPVGVWVWSIVPDVQHALPLSGSAQGFGDIPQKNKILSSSRSRNAKFHITHRNGKNRETAAEPSSEDSDKSSECRCKIETVSDSPCVQQDGGVSRCWSWPSPADGAWSKLWGLQPICRRDSPIAIARDWCGGHGRSVLKIHGWRFSALESCNCIILQT